MNESSTRITRAPASIENDFESAHTDALHAAGVLGLVYSALENGDLVASGRISGDTLCGSVCPDCGSRETEDNGASEYRCVECDHRWGRDYEGGDWYGAEVAA